MGESSLALLSRDELCAAISQQKATLAADLADYYALIREADGRADLMPRARPGTEAKTLLRELGVDTPDEDVRIARALGELPKLAQALATGEATKGQVKLAETAIRTIRKAATLDEATLTQVDTCLAEAARDLAPKQFKQIAERVVAHLHPNSGDTLNPQILERRELVLWKESYGWTGIHGHLPPDAGARLWAAMDRWAKPHPAHGPKSECEGAEEAEGGEMLPVHDRRSQGQRQADALSLALGLALGAATTTEPERPHVIVHVTPNSPVAEAGPSGLLSQAWVARFLCDATLQELRQDSTGELDLGRKARTATGRLRLALIARDRTCVIPGCTIPAEWSDAHHVQWWSKDGPTNPSNMAMLCGPHHTEVHAKTWNIELHNGTAWARPPRWIDPQQHWRKNTQKQHLKAIEQLTMKFQPPDSG